MAATRTRFVAVSAMLLVLGSCGGGSGGGGLGVIGTVAEKQDGTPFLVDANAGGAATQLRLLEVTRGRLVNIYSLSSAGLVLARPTLTDLVIRDSIQTDAGRYRLETNPISLETRLVILREYGALDSGSGTFLDLLLEATRDLAPILPRNDDGSDPPPFSYMPRNGCLSLRFNDLLDDSASAEARLVQTVRLFEGYAPSLRPFLTRMLFDPNHGALLGGVFRSTRILVDLTVSESELDGLAFSVLPNTTGLPRSQSGRVDSNVSLRIPTVPDQQETFFVLRSSGGAAMSLVDNGPVDPNSPTRDVVRAFRSGNPDDVNNGFLFDSESPEIVGAWRARIEAAAIDPLGIDPLREFQLAITFDSLCQSRLEDGDTIEAGQFLFEIVEDTGNPVLGRIEGIRVRSLDRAGVSSVNAILGGGRVFSTLDPNLGLPDACWVNFIPEPLVLPATGVATDARLVLRFTEPLEPSAITPFDSVIVQRGSSSSGGIVAEDIVVAKIEQSPDQRSFFFIPVFPLAHEQGRAEAFNLRLGNTTDLAGNQLRNGLAPLDFTLASTEPTEVNSSISLRFSALDEVAAPVPILIASNQNDLRGQFLIDTERGIVLPRRVNFTSHVADRSIPVPSLMIPFALGIQTPLSPLGSKLQTVWRYSDFGFLPLDETRHNIDVVGLSWTPLNGSVTRDSYPEFEIRLAHSRFLPDEDKTALNVPQYPGSGLSDGGPFASNIIRDPMSFQMVVHERSLGYEFSTLDRFKAGSGTLMVPFPMNHVGSGPLKSYTWRDSSILARGGPQGGGVPIDVEIGPPVNLFPTGFPKFYRRGEVRAVALPLLMEFRCFPSAGGLGLNSLDISIALNTGRQPNFRVFSTGGVDVSGRPQTVDPALEPIPLGGYNPTSVPPGQRTGFAGDNAFYLGQIDTVIRVSRMHSVWMDTRIPNPRFAGAEIEPPASDQPPGTEVILEFRAATGFLLPFLMDELPFVADNLDPFGDFPTRLNSTAEVLFLNGKANWTADLTILDGAEFIQLRVTFINNIETRSRPVLSAIGIPFAGG